MQPLRAFCIWLFVLHRSSSGSSKTEYNSVTVVCSAHHGSQIESKQEVWTCESWTGRSTGYAAIPIDHDETKEAECRSLVVEGEGV